MASSAVVGGGTAAAAASMELVSSSTTISQSVSRASASSSCSTRACSSKTNVCGISMERIVLCQSRSAGGTRTLLSLSSSSSSALQGTRLPSRGRGGRGRGFGVAVTPGVVHVRGADSVGENPDWTENDSIVVGLAHCFRKDDNQKLMNAFIVEPIPAGGLECMDNGGVTCYMHVTGTNLGTVLKEDISLLPSEFKEASFCEDFAFRTMCASRTWKRDHPQEKLMNLVPWDGTVRSDFNFNLTTKRVLNEENVVKDSDNIKQDMSIDVYGRTEKEEEMTAEIGQLYNA